MQSKLGGFFVEFSVTCSQAHRLSIAHIGAAVIELIKTKIVTGQHVGE